MSRTADSTLAAALAAVLACAVDASAQAAPFVGAGVERWAIASGHLGSIDNRLGLALEGGLIGTDGIIRVSLGWVPEGEVDPGWVIAAAEWGPRFRVAEAVRLGILLRAGRMRTSARNRSRVVEDCQPPCFFEADRYETGWSWIGGLAGTAMYELAPRVEIAWLYEANLQFGGPDTVEPLRGWSLALLYRLQ